MGATTPSDQADPTPPAHADIVEEEAIECTALENDWVDRPNPLMFPQCACPRCRPPEVFDAEPDGTWLRASGVRQRRAVERVTLGDAGRTALG